tara:strand:- start:276 stop:1532 length:1257 start_codon:yes stop_codon:yes gene_type:complete
MKYFRIHIYLNIKKFFGSFFFTFYNEKNDLKIGNFLIKNSKKKFFLLTSQCRISFLILLQYFKKNFEKKNEIIFLAYNLPEMINIAKNLNFKIIFCDLDYKTGFFNLKKLNKKINKKTIAVVMTNMFNSYEQSLKLKKICLSKKIFIVEDNAIYFDNYKKSKNLKKYSGQLGDFTLYSFNLMKNISGLYGGAITSNNKYFHEYSKNELLKYDSFPKLILLKQIFIFFILKILAVNLLYRYCFFKVIKYTHINNFSFLLKIFYPSLKFKVVNFPHYYFTKISSLSKKLVLSQLVDLKKRNKNHQIRKDKNIYYYEKLYSKKIKEISLIKISDFNYQNFIDFPILVKKRLKLNNYLLKNGIETRLYYYKNCENIFFNKRKARCINSQKFENNIICLPNGEKITFKYIDYIIQKISNFYLN